MNIDALHAHLATGTTTVCRVWRISRRDGVVLGFTDHDRDIVFDGVLHQADSGFTARSLQQTLGLSVDNSEAAGAISSDAIRAEDLAAGRYDAADVRIWLVNWGDPDAREEIFRGQIGEVTWRGQEFRAELRSLSDLLNQTVGDLYTRNCSAVLGDQRCRFDVMQPGYFTEQPIHAVSTSGRILRFAAFAGFTERWFEGGAVTVLTGEAAGLKAPILADKIQTGARVLELWHSLRARLADGDVVRLVAGCDKRPETCRSKFGNFLNFRGFPHLPGDDWVTSYPRPGSQMTGGSLVPSGQD